MAHLKLARKLLRVTSNEGAIRRSPRICADNERATRQEKTLGMAEKAVGEYGLVTGATVSNWSDKEAGGSISISRLVSLYRPGLLGYTIPVAYLLVGMLLYAGWKQRMEWPMNAEAGTGYLLGIIGGVLMLMLLLYPLRKHHRLMRNWGAVKHWFRTHMLFGVLGPVAIIFHSGFNLGSMNSRVALFCMFIVVVSGLVGRYFYVKVHHGLYGRRTDLEELQQHAELLRDSLSEEQYIAPAVLDKINRYQQAVTSKAANIHTSIWTLFSMGIRTWSLYFSFRFSLLKAGAGSADRLLVKHVAAHLSSIRKLAEFRFYERLFKIWHVVHLPLFLMLVFSGILHVVAVHMY